MDLGSPPQPPQPPGTVTHISESSNESIYRHLLDGKEVVIRISGNVTVAGDSALDVPAGARVDVEVRSPWRMSFTWDASGCSAYKASQRDACSSDEREFVIAKIKQQPTPPVPPR